jgi:hypothetical protein
MTDIVERLRQCDENFDLVQEAADEIKNLRKRLDGCEIIIVDQHADTERLRAALQRIANMASLAVPVLQMAASVARAALKEQK